jgi:Icc-related predicted phosphoesterase
MKNLLTTIIFTFLSTVSYSQNNVSELIQNFKEQADVNILTISGDLLRLGGNLVDANEEDSKDAKNLLNQVDELIIMNTSSEKKGEEIKKLAKKLVNKNDYEEMMMIDSDGEKINFFGKVKNKKIIELFIIVGSNQEQTILISMSGLIDPDSVYSILKKTGFN